MSTYHNRRKCKRWRQAYRKAYSSLWPVDLCLTLNSLTTILLTGGYLYTNNRYQKRFLLFTPTARLDFVHNPYRKLPKHKKEKKISCQVLWIFFLIYWRCPAKLLQINFHIQKTPIINWNWCWGYDRTHLSMVINWLRLLTNEKDSIDTASSSFNSGLHIVINLGWSV